MPWTAGWNQPGYAPNPDIVMEFDAWADAFQYLIDAVERFWADDYEAAGRDRFRCLEVDAVWGPMLMALNLAPINTEINCTSQGDEWAFWITPTEGTAQ